MVNLSIKKGSLLKEVLVPPSKSYANRALILSALIKSPITLFQVPKATDVTILVDCFKKIGLSVKENLRSLEIQNSFPECEKKGMRLEVGEGGTTARFLAAMLLLGKETYELVLAGRLKDRPWNEFIDLVRALGGTIDLKGNILTLKGPITLPEELEVDCSKTTQFATALQLLTIRTHSEIIPLNLNTSQSYWLMTKEMVKSLVSKNEYRIPLDWSSASYPLAFAALNHSISFPGLHFDELQADSKFYGILKSLGALKETDAGIEIHPIMNAQSLTLDVTDALDLVPTLGYFLSHIEGIHILRGVKNLVFKESDRLNEVIKLLSVFDKKAEHSGDDLIIHGSASKLKEEKKLELPHDHRMIMAGTLFLLHHGGGSVAPAEAVQKSYPEFFDIIRS